MNGVFRDLPTNAALADHAEVTDDWKQGFVEHTTAQTGLAGHVTMCVALSAEEGQKQNDVTLEFAAQRIAELAAEFPTRSIGVLVRRNQAVRQLIHLLRRA